MSEKSDWNTLNSIKLLKYINKHKAIPCEIDLQFLRDGGAELTVHIDRQREHPELIIKVRDVYDVFIDSNHLGGHSRCYCKLEVKDTIKKWLPRLLDNSGAPSIEEEPVEDETCTLTMN